MGTEELPLFPLNAVLFPGGQLSLRVFEARYLDLVRDCSHRGRGFGVCLILDGEEVGEPALPAAIGCEARIADFSTSPDGLLVLTVEGGRRFHVERSRVRDNGLVLGEVIWRVEPDAGEVRVEHELLATLLRRILERAGPPHDKVEKHQFQDPEWVSWRLAEWLPLSAEEKQDLLQLDDPHARMQHLLHAVARLQDA